MGWPASLLRQGKDCEAIKDGAVPPRDPASVWTWHPQLLTLLPLSRPPHPSPTLTSSPTAHSSPSCPESQALVLAQSGSRAWNMPGWYIFCPPGLSFLLQGALPDALPRQSILCCMTSRPASCL